MYVFRYYVCMYESIYECMAICICTYVLMYVLCVWMYVSMKRRRLFMCVAIFPSMSPYKCMFVCIQVIICICTFTYAHTLQTKQTRALTVLSIYIHKHNRCGTFSHLKSTCTLSCIQKYIRVYTCRWWSVNECFNIHVEEEGEREWQMEPASEWKRVKERCIHTDIFNF